MESALEVADKAALGCIATAVVAVLTLAAVPRADLDTPLIFAVEHYLWSVPFLGGYLALEASKGKLKIQELVWWVRWVLRLWLTIGFWFWTVATSGLMDHFGMAAVGTQVLGMLAVFCIPFAIGRYIRWKAKKAQSERASIDSR